MKAGHSLAHSNPVFLYWNLAKYTCIFVLEHFFSTGIHIFSYLNIYFCTGKIYKLLLYWNIYCCIGIFIVVLEYLLLCCP